jgi:hypothetical protein
MDPIRFVGKVETGEMVRAYKLAWRNTWQMTARILFYLSLGVYVAVMALIGWQSFRDGDLPSALRRLGFGGIALVFLLISELNLRQKVARSLKAGLFNEEGAAVVDDDGVALGDGQASLNVVWERFDGFRSTDDIVVYYVSFPRSFVAFFRRLSESPSEWTRFCTLSNERLRRR